MQKHLAASILAAFEPSPLVSNGFRAPLATVFEPSLFLAANNRGAVSEKEKSAETLRSFYVPEWIFRELPVRRFRLLVAHDK